MNFIVPREECVDSVIVDLRDVAGGWELLDHSLPKKGDDVLKPAEYTAYIFYIPRHLFVNKGQNADYDTIVRNIRERNIPKVEKYVDNLDFFRELIETDERNKPAFEHTKILYDYFDNHRYNIIELPKDKFIIVGAPLWEYSVQLILVKTFSPFIGQEDYYGKVTSVQSMGICDLEFARQFKAYKDGYGVGIRNFKQFSRQSEREKTCFQESDEYER